MYFCKKYAAVFFQADFTPIIIVLLSVAGVLALIAVTVYRFIILRPARHQRLSDSHVVGTDYPAVSIVVHARDNARGLEMLLDDLLHQNYPAPYEVVVVNDGGVDEVAAVVTRLSTGDERLRVTFVPDKAYNLSRRKLAITLGVKAARYPYAIILDADCRLGGIGWLEAMGRHFAQGKEVVTGHCAVTGPAPAVTRVDNLIETVTWLSPAIKGRPYRASSVNLGYSRELFFTHKGFARTLNLLGGDDDLFINEIATWKNSAVELGEESIVTIDDRDARGRYLDDRRSHGFTGRMLPKRHRRIMRVLTASLWLSVAVAVAVGILSWPNLLPLTIALVLMLIQWAVAVYAWYVASRVLHYGLKVGAVFRGVALSPVYTVKEWLRAHRNTDRNYTWYYNTSRTKSL